MATLALRQTAVEAGEEGAAMDHKVAAGALTYDDAAIGEGVHPVAPLYHAQRHFALL